MLFVVFVDKTLDFHKIVVLSTGALARYNTQAAVDWKINVCEKEDCRGHEVEAGKTTAQEKPLWLRLGRGRVKDCPSGGRKRNRPDRSEFSIFDIDLGQPGDSRSCG